MKKEKIKNTWIIPIIGVIGNYQKLDYLQNKIVTNLILDILNIYKGTL